MSKIIIYIMVLFSIIGCIDKILGNKFGLGEKFEKGFKEMGGLALVMIGLYCFSPIIGQILIPILSPISKLTGIDSSVFISSILACDMGGYTTSLEIAQNQKLAQFSGLILASMMGSTISFTIPIAVNKISKQNFNYFAKGILSGIVTIPIGCFAGGLIMKISLYTIILNIVPVMILSIVISICLIKIQDKIIKIFSYIGKLILLISSIGLIFSILSFILDIKVFSNMIVFEESLIIVGKIAVILSGAYPLIGFISKVFEDKFSRVGKKLNVNEMSVLGLIMSLANSIPMLEIFKDMDSKGKIMNSAFVVSGAFTFGGQLGFVSSISKEMITPFVISKLVAGFSAVILSVLIVKFEERKNLISIK